MKILFAATPEIACPALRALAESKKVEIGGVLTSPPSESGRGKKILPTAVSVEAQRIKDEAGLTFPIFSPEKLNEEFCKKISRMKIDLLVCFAYGKIFSPEFLSVFNLGGINFHPSLLPKFRGPSPIQAAILAGERETGWTVQRLAEKMDSGDILLQGKMLLDGSETAKSIADEVAAMAGEALLTTILALEDKSAKAIPQKEQDATFCRMIRKGDALIEWKRSAKLVDAQIRAYNPSPVAFTTLGEKRLFLHYSSLADTAQEGKPGEVLLFKKGEGFLVKCAEGAIWAKTLQWQAKKVLDGNDFFNGNQSLVGKVLGE